MMAVEAVVDVVVEHEGQLEACSCTREVKTLTAEEADRMRMALRYKQASFTRF